MDIKKPAAEVTQLITKKALIYRNAFMTINIDKRIEDSYLRLHPKILISPSLEEEDPVVGHLELRLCRR